MMLQQSRSVGEPHEPTGPHRRHLSELTVRELFLSLDEVEKSLIRHADDTPSRTIERLRRREQAILAELHHRRESPTAQSGDR